MGKKQCWCSVLHISKQRWYKALWASILIWFIIWQSLYKRALIIWMSWWRGHTVHNIAAAAAVMLQNFCYARQWQDLETFFFLSAIGTPFKEVKYGCRGWCDEMLHSRLMIAESSPDYSLIFISLARHWLSIKMDVPLSCAHYCKY